MHSFLGGTTKCGSRKTAINKLMKFLHKGECNYAEKVIKCTKISMQFNFSVLSMPSFVAPQNAGIMDCSMQV